VKRIKIVGEKYYEIKSWKKDIIGVKIEILKRKKIIP
jgi:hypothetical protein